MSYFLSLNIFFFTMQLKYNRQQGIGSSIARILMKLVLIFIVSVVAIFLIEKINFPSPKII